VNNQYAQSNDITINVVHHYLALSFIWIMMTGDSKCSVFNYEYRDDA